MKVLAPIVLLMVVGAVFLWNTNSPSGQKQKAPSASMTTPSQKTPQLSQEQMAKLRERLKNWKPQLTAEQLDTLKKYQSSGRAFGYPMRTPDAK